MNRFIWTFLIAFLLPPAVFCQETTTHKTTEHTVVPKKNTTPKKSTVIYKEHPTANSAAANKKDNKQKITTAKKATPTKTGVAITTKKDTTHTPKVKTQQKIVATKTATIAVKKDSIIPQKTISSKEIFMHQLNPTAFHFERAPVYMIDAKHKPAPKGNDTLFYVIIAILLLYGVIRTLFPKYFGHLFSNLWNAQQRLRLEKHNHIAQHNLPSILLNIMFCITGGLCLTLLNEYYHTIKKTEFSFWIFWGIFSGAIATIYLIKYLVISFFGYMFNNRNNAYIYTSIVFLVNKIAGLCIIPLCIILSFLPQSSLLPNIIRVTSLVLGCLLLFRYIASFRLIILNMKSNALHFFIYLCAVEILPLLIVCKILMQSMQHLS